MRSEQIVGGIYALFGKGDIPAIVELISDDVRWEHWANNHAQKAGVPYLQAGRGKEGVMKFFQSLSAIEMRDFQVLSLCASQDLKKVVAEVVIEFTVKATGKVLRDEELHLWTLDDHGKVIGMRHYIDTAKHIDANTR